MAALVLNSRFQLNARAATEGRPYSLSVGLKLRLRSKIVIAETAIECGGGDAEDFGGLAAVPAGLFESGENLLTLNFTERSGRAWNLRDRKNRYFRTRNDGNTRHHRRRHCRPRNFRR